MISDEFPVQLTDFVLKIIQTKQQILQTKIVLLTRKVGLEKIPKISHFAIKKSKLAKNWKTEFLKKYQIKKIKKNFK